MADTNLTDSGDVIKDIQMRIKRAESYVKPWHDNIDRWRRLYDMQHYNKRGKTEVLYDDPTYTNTVDLSVGIMLGNDLTFHAYGFSPSKKEQETTGKMEKLILGTIEANNEREEKHQIYELFLQFNRDGGGVIYSVFDPELAKNTTSKSIADPNSDMGMTTKSAFAEVPIRMQVIDAKKVICLPGGPKRWLLIGRKEERTVMDVEANYNIKLRMYTSYGQEEKSTMKGTFYDVWDYVWVGDLSDPTNRKLAVRNTRMFNNEVVFGPQVMNGYQDLPYSIQFFKPVGDDAAQWQSILSPLESSVIMMERTFNRRAKQIDVFTGMPLVVKAQPGRTVIVDPGLYNSMTISPDESIEFPTWPGNSPDVEQHLNFLRSRVQQSGFSDVMFGSGNNQVAGYALSQLGDQNRIRLQQPIEHIQLLLTTWAKKTMRLLETFAPGRMVCVYGHHKGEDYMDYVDIDELKGYSIRAEIRPNFPNEEMRQVAMSTQVKGLISDYTRMQRFLKIEQPEDEEMRKLIEAATNNPAAQMYAMMAELDKRAQMGDKIAAMTLQTLQNNGAPGQPGRPNEPNNPEQPTGLASSTGQTNVGAPNGSTPANQQEKMSGAAVNSQGVLNQ